MAQANAQAFTVLATTTTRNLNVTCVSVNAALVLMVSIEWFTFSVWCVRLQSWYPLNHLRSSCGVRFALNDSRFGRWSIQILVTLACLGIHFSAYALDERLAGATGRDDALTRPVLA